MPAPLRPKVGIGTIIIKNNKILLGKRLNAHGEGSWALPGGHLEYQESWEECAIREVKEETNLNIENPKFVYITNDIFAKERKHYITIFMQTNLVTGDLKILEPDKCQEWKWFKWEDLPDKLFLPIQNLLKEGFKPKF